MPTLHVHRLIICVPQASYGSVFNWYQANVDSSDDGSTWRSLNATGLMADPETHRAANTALTEPLARSIINRVCQLTGTPMPTLPQWNGWTKAEKYAWLRATRQALYTASGIWLDLADNEGAWDDPQAVIGPLGLQARQEAPA